MVDGAVVNERDRSDAMRFRVNLRSAAGIAAAESTASLKPSLLQNLPSLVSNLPSILSSFGAVVASQAGLLISNLLKLL
ncbi:hypothetical protein [Mycobacterium malmoense]|uniref:hypothetical protein n=1 Tax=Mycobacterium malmoense TaxID=1780 RepID=UPI0008F8BA82|nr:hypothetical protein [Mycobacterium malmoense]OIN79678.1 hypothetical protein BMG05_16120 [Mycobacterium malmoense]